MGREGIHNFPSVKYDAAVSAISKRSTEVSLRDGRAIQIFIPLNFAQLVGIDAPRRIC